MTASWSGPHRGPTEYKVAARSLAPYGGLPSVRSPCSRTMPRREFHVPRTTGLVPSANEDSRDEMLRDVARGPPGGMGARVEEPAKIPLTAKGPIQAVTIPGPPWLCRSVRSKQGAAQWGATGGYHKSKQHGRVIRRRTWSLHRDQCGLIANTVEMFEPLKLTGCSTVISVSPFSRSKWVMVSSWPSKSWTSTTTCRIFDQS